LDHGAHDIPDGRLELVRLCDEKRVVWDLHEHRAINHGYATTSYRSQGRTVDSVFALASAAEARRGLYVDVTRAREDVTIAYGKDEVQDFGELLARAQRDNWESAREWSGTSTCGSSAKLPRLDS
jgi:ATP-dependent exoDNAse (exonuclease V) alpha subunit